MKKTTYLPNILKRVVFGAAVLATSSMCLTACNDKVSDNVTAADELSQTPENGSIIPGKYIVVLKGDDNAIESAGRTYAERTQAAKDLASSILSERGIDAGIIEHTYGNTIRGFSGSLSADEVNKLRNDSRVAYVEEDRVISLSKPVSSETASASTITDEVPYGIARVGLANGAGKTAWVIDSGVQLNHPDLNVDVARSITVFASGRDARSADDLNGHGTHVAGTIAAKKDGKGVIGVAYDATVVAIKVLDARGSGSYSGVIQGVDYVGANGKAGEVANMSLGGPVSQALDDAILKASSKGIYFTLAAGNDGKDANTASPARVNGTYIYTISAMNNTDTWASFSNWGNPPVDYCQPGVSIKSTWISSGYRTISGTSMAAPHMAGVLLVSGSNFKTDGFVKNDPDGKPDPIAVVASSEL
jgi:subtilisin family serine protease